MRAALCKSLDGPGGISIEDVAEPEPGPGEVIVEVRAAALNFFDTLITRGKYQSKPDLPFSPGGEIAGVVAALGSGVEAVAIGDRVAAYVGWGGARERVAVPAASLVAIPDAVADETAAGASITYGTAIHGLSDRGRIQPGETVAVLGAAGGAGLAAVEIAKLLGARVIAVASSAGKLAICREHGADDLVLYPGGDLKTALRDAAGGRGVDIVYDCVGGEASEPALRAMAWAGRFLVIGFAAGEIPRLPLNLLLVKGCEAVGVYWGEFVRRNPERHRANMRRVLDWVAEGKLSPRTHAVFPLDRITDAFDVIERREATGKVVIRM